MIEIKNFMKLIKKNDCQGSKKIKNYYSQEKINEISFFPNKFT